MRAGGGEGSFDVPSGASTGSREARELRDPDGGLTKAMRCITEEIAPALFGRDAEKQRLIDETLLALDGTPLKERMGGNSLIGGADCCYTKHVLELGKKFSVVWPDDVRHAGAELVDIDGDGDEEIVTQPFAQHFNQSHRTIQRERS